MNNSIYIIFSATPFKMGSFIRFFTREKYNHVSLSLNGDFSEAYCFARHYVNTPFYGGLVKDSSSRYKYKKKLADIAVCELRLDEDKYNAIVGNIRNMYAHRDEYVYNTFSAICALFKCRAIKKNAYTCVEFASDMISTVDTRIDTKKFYSVISLMSIFANETVYAGKFDFPVYDDTSYSEKKSIGFAISHTLSNFTELIKR